MHSLLTKINSLFRPSLCIYVHAYICMYIIFDYTPFSTAINKISCALEDLLRQAGSQNNKLDEMCNSLESLSYGFASLGKDVKDLSSLSSDKLDLASEEGECVEEYKEDTLSTLESISDALEECKASLVSIETQVHPCGGIGWREVVYLDLTDSTVSCPMGWSENTFTDGSRTVRGCSRTTLTDGSIDMTSFTNTGGSYNEVCGRINGFASGNPEAFVDPPLTIDQVYVDGVSLTHGNLNHIWTFAAAGFESTTTPTSTFNCPCYGGPAAPAEVGMDFFCEAGVGDVDPLPTGVLLDDLLWDGEMCTTDSCCAQNGPPYFTTHLDNPTDDAIDARLIFQNEATQDNILITKIHLFVRLVETDPM